VEEGGDRWPFLRLEEKKKREVRQGMKDSGDGERCSPNHRQGKKKKEEGVFFLILASDLKEKKGKEGGAWATVAGGKRGKQAPVPAHGEKKENTKGGGDQDMDALPLPKNGEKRPGGKERQMKEEKNPFGREKKGEGRGFFPRGGKKIAQGQVEKKNPLMKEKKKERAHRREGKSRARRLTILLKKGGKPLSFPLFQDERKDIEKEKEPSERTPWLMEGGGGKKGGGEKGVSPVRKKKTSSTGLTGRGGGGALARCKRKKPKGENMFAEALERGGVGWEGGNKGTSLFRNFPHRRKKGWRLLVRKGKKKKQKGGKEGDQPGPEKGKTGPFVRLDQRENKVRFPRAKPKTPRRKGGGWFHFEKNREEDVVLPPGRKKIVIFCTEGEVVKKEFFGKKKKKRPFRKKGKKKKKSSPIPSPLKRKKKFARGRLRKEKKKKGPSHKRRPSLFRELGGRTTRISGKKISPVRSRRGEEKKKKKRKGRWAKEWEGKKRKKPTIVP